MNYDDLYDFSFRIETIGVKDVGDFKGVISELRYYFTGTYKENLNVKQRFAVYSFNVENLVEEQFIPFEKVDSDMLHDWLKLSVHEDNLASMKKDIHLLFNPPITYYNLSHFNSKSELKQTESLFFPSPQNPYVFVKDKLSVDI